MSITLYTYGTGDFSLHGFSDYSGAGSSTANNFALAKGYMEADAWSNDAYALMQAGMYVYPAWRGIGHLKKYVPTWHLEKVASGHLRKDAGEITGSARCIALADMCAVGAGDVGTSVTAITVNFAATVQNVSSIPGYTAEFYFKTTATASPASDWGWFTGTPYKTIAFSASAAAADYTFTGITGFTLNNWFWCLYRLSDYSIPSYDDSNLTPVSTYYTKDVIVSCGLSNTYVINP